jgi:hypothetical protein
MGKQNITPENIASSDYIEISVAIKKKYLPISKRQLARMCEAGIFKSAFKPGTGGKTSRWKILRSEILAHRLNGHAVQY